ncbi:hypothetical protein A3Q56_05493 [Intoshia linei]|uniref:Uncharacterized protein n=1 Tax=Intoshia linei TaxID=1819745 RepID=A0A177AXT1_9BILA|nr:hypothetical protein A3Q56_05493 [Intoshia linei]
MANRKIQIVSKPYEKKLKAENITTTNVSRRVKVTTLTIIFLTNQLNQRNKNYTNHEAIKTGFVSSNKPTDNAYILMQTNLNNYISSTIDIIKKLKSPDCDMEPGLNEQCQMHYEYILDFCHSENISLSNNPHIDEKNFFAPHFSYVVNIHRYLLKIY